ncbi:MAG: DDE-type integrase/transposase/recombinase [Acidimicrobiia bacterium]
MRSSRTRSTTRRKYANNRIETDHSRLKSRVRSVRGLKTDRSACVIVAGHTFIQNLRRAHYELGQKLVGTSAPKQHSPTRSNQPRSPAPTQRLFRVGCTVFVTTITAVFLLGIAQFLRWEYEDDELEPTADRVGARGVRSGHTARNGARP